MKTRYDTNYIYKFYEVLDEVIHSQLDNPETYMESYDYIEVEQLLSLILLNNGCKQGENVVGKVRYENIIGDEMDVLFITGWLGNDVNEYYDVIDFYGCTSLVIFMDYFKDIMTVRPEINDQDQSIESIAILNMGNSVYYDAVCKLTEVFMLLTMNPMYQTQTFAATCASGLFRFNPSIVAINILNDICPIEQEDIPDMPIEQARTYIGNMSLTLLGVRTV